MKVRKLSDHCKLNLSFTVRLFECFLDTLSGYKQATHPVGYSGLTSTQYDTTPLHEYKAP